MWFVDIEIKLNWIELQQEAIVSHCIAPWEDEEVLINLNMLPPTCVEYEFDSWSILAH